MLSLLLLAWLFPSQSEARLPIDVTKIEAGAPVVVTQIDTGKMKGDLRRLAWSPEGDTLYLQTAEGNPPTERLRHFAIAVAAGTLTPLDAEPEWAARYWAHKQDRVAPGIPSLVIDILQGVENIKTGTGAPGVLDRSSSPDAVAAGNPSVDNLAAGNMGNDKATVVRLTLLDETIATWTNERPIPGMRFSWGPERSGALVFLGDKNQLIFFDQKKQKQAVAGTRDTVLPAWSSDGRRLAYLQKTGRKKFAVTCMPVGW